MPHSIDFENMQHDPRDPNPWLALYLDHSTPVDPAVKNDLQLDRHMKSSNYLYVDGHVRMIAASEVEAWIDANIDFALPDCSP